mmetsp:Transcript_53255/g.114401  ORF Transcript_53255/g.114401 Transcript_53255/m.114401 type:complete len:225 (+) Transcript_53255:173-847(+)
MVGHCPAVVALGSGVHNELPWKAVGVIPVSQQGGVIHVPDADGVQAGLHVEILSAIVAYVLGAERLVCDVGIHGLLGQHFEGPHEAKLEVAVREVHGSVRGRPELPEMLLEAVREKDGIWVNLHSEVVDCVPAVLVDLIPDVDEDVRVCNRQPLSLLRLEALQDSMGIAAENAKALQLLVVHEHGLGGVRHHHLDAEERCTRHMLLGRWRDQEDRLIRSAEHLT